MRIYDFPEGSKVIHFQQCHEIIKCLQVLFKNKKKQTLKSLTTAHLHGHKYFLDCGRRTAGAVN